MGFPGLFFFFFFKSNIFFRFHGEEECIFVDVSSTVTEQLQALTPQFKNTIAETSLPVDVQPSRSVAEIIQIPNSSLS